MLRWQSSPMHALAGTYVCMDPSGTATLRRVSKCYMPFSRHCQVVAGTWSCIGVSQVSAGDLQGMHRQGSSSTGLCIPGYDEWLM